MPRNRKTDRPVANAELSVLEQLWQRGKLTAREVAAEVYQRTTDSDIRTVQNLLKRLEGKDLVQRDRRLHVHVFSPNISRQEYAAEQLETVAERLSEGSIVPLILHLVKGDRLTEADRKEIRRLLDDSD